MKRRVWNKISNRLFELDKALSQCFYEGGLRTHRREIKALRWTIRYHARRWPAIYARTFAVEFGTLNLGHRDSGR